MFLLTDSGRLGRVTVPQPETPGTRGPKVGAGTSKGLGGYRTGQQECRGCVCLGPEL